MSPPPDVIFELEIRKNVFEAGASPQISLGELTVLPRLAK